MEYKKRYTAMTEKISYKEWYLLHFHNGMGVNGVLDENNKPHEDYIPLLRKMYMRYLDMMQSETV